jgi:hypothetical protein
LRDDLLPRPVRAKFKTPGPFFARWAALVERLAKLSGKSQETPQPRLRALFLIETPACPQARAAFLPNSTRLDLQSTHFC